MCGTAGTYVLLGIDHILDVGGGFGRGDAGESGCDAEYMYSKRRVCSILSVSIMM